MATTAKTVYSHIVKDTQVRSGRACIDQTRIAVVDVIFRHTHEEGLQDILAHYPSLSLEQVHAALSYYYGHKDEIDAELCEDDGWEEEHERAKLEHLPRRSQ